LTGSALRGSGLRKPQSSSTISRQKNKDITTTKDAEITHNFHPETTDFAANENALPRDIPISIPSISLDNTMVSSNSKP